MGVPRAFLETTLSDPIRVRAILDDLGRTFGPKLRSAHGGQWRVICPPTLGISNPEKVPPDERDSLWFEHSCRLLAGLRRGVQARVRWEAIEPEILVETLPYSRLEEWLFPALVGLPMVAATLYGWWAGGHLWLGLLAGGGGAVLGLFLYALLAAPLTDALLAGPRERCVETVEAVHAALLEATRDAFSPHRK